MQEISYRKISYSTSEFLSIQFESGNSYINSVQHVCRNWLLGSDNFVLHTSGSTGKPKELHFSRDQLLTSAQQTVETFGLQKGDRLLSCLSPEHAAGFMMIIRALAYEMNLFLHDPQSNPLQEIETHTRIDFAAFVPYQLATILKNEPEKKAVLNKMKAIILGGGPVPDVLQHEVGELECPVFHTFGMTETLTHVAIRDLKENTQIFRALKGVEFSQDEKQCLLIKSPVHGNQWLHTHDLVKLINDYSFEWIGRIDHVINSAGLKLHPSQIEQQISASMQLIFPDCSYFVFSLPDEDFGEKLCLLIEGEENAFKTARLKTEFQVVINPYEIPKDIYFLKNFEYSELGKIDRAKSIKLPREHG